MTQSRYLHYLKIMLTSPRKTSKRIINILSNAEAFSVLSDTFLRQEYWWLKGQLVANSVIIDIGANIGDTTIYFAQFDRAKKVIGYEPMPYLYAKAKKNISLVPFKSKISIKNMAISSPGSKFIRYNAGSHVSSWKDTNQAHGNEGTVVKSDSLNNQINGLKNVFIKCDCEGGEYTIFTKDADLREVRAIQIEYHNGYSTIQKILIKKGFKVSHKETLKSGVGYIYASRPKRDDNIG